MQPNILKFNLLQGDLVGFTGAPAYSIAWPEYLQNRPDFACKLRQKGYPGLANAELYTPNAYGLRAIPGPTLLPLYMFAQPFFRVLRITPCMSKLGTGLIVYALVCKASKGLGFSSSEKTLPLLFFLSLTQY